ncbi:MULTISPECIES: DapH/DapD/GlmU-related protein [unclassified Bacillus (in: firmicutes)]|uniref:acyltransferase n=1 Tax=unclassified Bacillus (in: firmicutes) TaxID=185979 RepID=UPI001BEC62C0|nr:MULTISPECIES: acyltransferase [unclassified Bacillus (in: firmicutes)]MBT2614114.1 acyltransferase [Bacillus sp. ISL-78]MBT2629375.1 acyltransferase [Bacillus sp. ISL-101]
MSKLKSCLSLIIWNLFVNTLGKSILVPQNLRYMLYKMAGMKTSSSNIRSGCTFRGKSLVIEKDVFLNHNVFIDSWEKVTIKENAAIAFDVLICTSGHKIGESFKRAGVSDRKPIVIGKGCWVGARSTILPGVILGDGCVIAAGSVVTKDCKPNTLYAGVPAKEIRSLEDDKPSLHAL